MVPIMMKNMSRLMIFCQRKEPLGERGKNLRLKILDSLQEVRFIKDTMAIIMSTAMFKTSILTTKQNKIF